MLDLGCGSGASTRAVLDAWSAGGRLAGGLSVTGVDASEGMVGQARAKAWPASVTLVVSDAVAYLESLPSGSVDGVLAAYLLRNVPDRDALVARGGPRAAPRRRHRHPRLLGGGQRPRPRRCGPPCATASSSRSAVVMRSDVPLHRYLYTSVRDFDSVDRICERLLAAGLVDVRHRSFPGWQHGLVHTVAGSAPS